MDAFEELAAQILWMEGYWVRTSVKVELTKEDKKAIGRPSSPRWEIDVVGYSGRDNVLRIVECKSYLDSTGVRFSSFEADSSDAQRYKLFFDNKLRDVVFNRLKLQLAASGACREDSRVELSLACGKIRNDDDRKKLRAHFLQNNWELLDESWLQERLKRMSKGSYENQVAAVVSKLLLRGKVD
jgi:hypothetical protein